MGTDRRTAMIYASTVDLDEAYQAGADRRCPIAVAGRLRIHEHDPARSGRRSTTVRYDKVALELVANSERAFPQRWIAPNRIDVTDEFVRYARPLIGDHWPAVPLVDGRQRFARLRKIFAVAEAARVSAAGTSSIGAALADNTGGTPTSLARRRRSSSRA